MQWRVIVEKDQDTEDYAVWCPELPGRASAGATEMEALENIKEAIELYLEPSFLTLPHLEARLLTQYNAGQ